MTHQWAKGTARVTAKKRNFAWVNRPATVMALSIRLFAHQAYIERRGRPLSVADLTGHCLIGFDRDDRSVRGIDLQDLPVTRESFAFRSDNDLVQMAALRAGLGIAGCQTGLARRHGALTPVLHEMIRFALEMWLVMHEDQRLDRRVRLLFDHLATALGAYIAECAM
jgi:DNA-binding transcriptional LysR family regulator